MQAYKFNIDIPANHRYEFTFPEDIPAGEAEVIVLAKNTPRLEADKRMDLREFSEWLKQQAPTGRSREEIDAQIAEERNSWGED
jgi:hypothetical protein